MDSFFTAPVAIVKQAENIIAVEGDNVEVYCNVTGIPDPTVIWTNVDTSEIFEGNLLNITNITWRLQAGDYRCTANNTCGEESTMASIKVLCKKITITVYIICRIILAF